MAALVVPVVAADVKECHFYLVTATTELPNMSLVDAPFLYDYLHAAKFLDITGRRTSHPPSLPR
jgi:hypothetical protein